MTLIEQIKLDRESGTDGPWAYDKWNSLTSPLNRAVSVWGLGIAHACRDAETEANARRMARTPAMEEALLAAVDVLIECREACLVGDDDGITVSEDVVITIDLFDRICSAINCKALEVGQ